MELPRRKLLSAMALGSAATATGVALPARAEDHPERRLTYAEKREIHRALLWRATDDFHSVSCLSLEGITRALAGLVYEDIIVEEDSVAISRVVDHLFNRENMGELFERIEGLIEEIDVSTLSEAAETIIAVAHDSIEYARELLWNEEYEAVRMVIAHDIQGAIQGARVARRLGWPGSIALSILGGGAAGSVIGYFRNAG
ncbi:MAG: hypothetical protein OXQ84_21340 [bacterium]|nr:hypothetical protein [bacterium]